MSDIERSEYEGNEAEEFAKRLNQVSVNVVKWEIRFIDPQTSAQWVMDFPHSEMHGGGPPRLRKVVGTRDERQ